MTVYFIQEQGGDNLIKIGKADIFQRRFTQVAANRKYSLKILGLMDGDEREEKILHKVFSSFRRDGEWFEPCEMLLDFIKENTISPRQHIERTQPTRPAPIRTYESSLLNRRYGPDSAERDFIDPDILHAVTITDCSDIDDNDAAGWYAVARPIVREFSKKMAPGTARKHVNRAYYKIYGKPPPSVVINRKRAGAPEGNQNAAAKD